MFLVRFSYRGDRTVSATALDVQEVTFAQVWVNHAEALELKNHPLQGAHE